MKKLLILVLTAVLLFSMAVPAFAENEELSVRPSGICVDGGQFLITDVFNKQILRGSGQSWTVVAGKKSEAGASGEPLGIYKDGPAGEAYFMSPWAIVGFMGGYAISDPEADVVRFLSGGTVQTLITKTAGLDHPTGLATDGELLYVADSGNDRVVAMDKKGAVKVVVSNLGGPTGLAWDDGVLYICETDKNRIVSFKDGKVELVAGKAIADGDEYQGGYVNGKTSVAEFDHPVGILANDGTIYVSDTGNLAVRQIKDGRVTTLADSGDVGYKASYPRGLALSGTDLIVADVFFPYPVAISTLPITFSDVAADSPDAEAVSKAVNYRLINGFEDGSFRPDAYVTRAQFVTMLSRAQLFMDGQAVIDGDAVFTDVPEGSWFEKPVNWAAAEGYMLGRVKEGKRIADPKSVLKASEIDHFLERFAAALGVSYEPIAEDPHSPVSRLTAASGLVSLLEKAGY
jgi:sugar lactone lactonase YvrE